MTKLQELKKAIHTACPELEDERICICGHKDNRHACRETTGSETPREFSRTLGIGKCELCNCSRFEILGHKIGIAEVLRASKDRMAIDNHEEFIRLDKFEGKEVPHWMDMYWSLEHNDLDWHAENKPELINFLYEILSEK